MPPKKTEKIKLTPNQVKFIKLYSKKFLREAEYDNQTFVDELTAHLKAYVRIKPKMKKSVKLADGSVYKPIKLFDKALISAAKYIRSCMTRYHRIYYEYENTQNLTNDPLLNGPFYELYEQTCKADTTLEKINEIVREITYQDREDYVFILLSLLYELGDQIRAIDVIRQRPAAEKTRHKMQKDSKRPKPSRKLPDDIKPWLISRARILDESGMDRRLMFKALAKEIHMKHPVQRPFSWRCLQNHLLQHLPKRHKNHLKDKLRDIEDWG